MFACGVLRKIESDRVLDEVEAPEDCWDWHDDEALMQSDRQEIRASLPHFRRAIARRQRDASAQRRILDELAVDDAATSIDKIAIELVTAETIRREIAGLRNTSCQQKKLEALTCKSDLAAIAERRAQRNDEGYLSFIEDELEQAKACGAAEEVVASFEHKLATAKQEVALATATRARDGVSCDVLAEVAANSERCAKKIAAELLASSQHNLDASNEAVALIAADDFSSTAVPEVAAPTQIPPPIPGVIDLNLSPRLCISPSFRRATPISRVFFEIQAGPAITRH